MMSRTGRPNPKQLIDGILLINKVPGCSSNAVLQRVKHLLGAKKAGHTGSLDPMATGMLPICFGEATKFSQYILNANKTYTATGCVGIKTNTADAMGEVIARVEGFNISESQLRDVLSLFTGTTKQIPSMFSALKHNGTPLYTYARAGIEIERAARDITIDTLLLTNFDGTYFDLTVGCSKGTYIRNLVEDIGERLGVGAHVTALHRLFTAGFVDTPMITIEALEALTLEERRSLLLPVDIAVTHFPRLDLSQEQFQLLSQGQVLTMNHDAKSGDIVRLYVDLTRFVGLGEWQTASELKTKRLINIMSNKHCNNT